MKRIVWWVIGRPVVRVDWEGRVIEHLARGWSDAHEWARCYPVGAWVRFAVRGRVVAWRMP